jgi:hypothetical protein
MKKIKTPLWLEIAGIAFTFFVCALIASPFFLLDKLFSKKGKTTDYHQM